jgi:hypothetical protein
LTGGAAGGYAGVMIDMSGSPEVNPLGGMVRNREYEECAKVAD